MPEGDTVRKIADYLQPRLTGCRIEAGRVRHRPDIELAGRVIQDVHAHGKHLFIRLDDGTLLRSHLGMHGSWHRYPAGKPWRRPREEASIELTVEGQTYVCFHAEEVEHVRAGSVRERQIETGLGPDLLQDAIDLDAVVERAGRFVDPDALAVDLLLDQRVASGIGNVYKSEILFIERIDPRLRAGDLGDSRIRRLFETGRSLLQRNIGRGPRTTRFAGDAAGRLWVYGRRGLPCFRCGRPIRRAMLGRTRRSTYWCETCQGSG